MLEFYRTLNEILCRDCVRTRTTVLLSVLKDRQLTCDRCGAKRGEPERQQEYGIYLPAPIDRWIGVQSAPGCNRYVEREHAIGFETATRALIIAVEAIGLAPADFQVRPL